jgi:hypothetical protein
VLVGVWHLASRSRSRRRRPLRWRRLSLAARVARALRRPNWGTTGGGCVRVGTSGRSFPGVGAGPGLAGAAACCRVSRGERSAAGLASRPSILFVSFVFS